MSGPTNDDNQGGSLDIAIIGMAGRFPGANHLQEFWENLKYGVESIRFYPEKEVLDSGIFPEMVRDPDFVPAAGGIDHEFDFDAEFFEFNPREAEIMDPQQRIMLECAWETLESAGYNPETYAERIGVFAGASINTYLMFNIVPNRQLLNSVGHFQVMTANDKDFLATRIAYKLNLKGPAMSIQTACSTSLVAANAACQSLLNFQTDMALAGGVSITPKGRLYKEGFIFSKDGHCRAFDAGAQGTVGGNGVGFVLLKRLNEALADGDYIHAVIKGSAINNDGSMKVGYTAPSVNGQAEVILQAQAMAGVHPDTITYVEAHGTGTLLGDPIEIAALTQAFRTRTERKQYCAIGSVKTNIGHLDTAAGISGMIKAALAIEHGQIPPSLHYQTPNPKLNIEQTPFFVNTELSDWTPPPGVPRRAAVSSFGFGGTNAHAILEQAPARAPTAPGRGWQLLLFSGRNEAALKSNMQNLARHLQQHPQTRLADVAYTLQVGRKAFRHRAYVAVKTVEDAATVLEVVNPKRVQTSVQADSAAGQVAFMFSGQGSQYIDMARELYDTEPAYAQALKECASLMQPHLDHDLLDVIYPDTAKRSTAEALLAQTQYTQPALFAVEHALAKLWESWGVTPVAMIGHSIGEYVAATLAGVFTLKDAARLICARGRLIQAQAPGAMLSVPLGEEMVRPWLNARLSLAAVNAPNLTVISGAEADIETLRLALAAKNIEARRLHVSHAFHSHMMQAAAAEYETICRSARLSPPVRRFVSNVTGDWITEAQALSPRYWADHLRQTVRFSDGVRTLLQAPSAVLLEVGPGQVLTTLARQQRELLKGAMLVASTRHPLTSGSDVAQLLEAAGALWARNVAIDWAGFHRGAERRRVPLPTYAFQRKRYWLPPVYLDMPTIDLEASTSVGTNESDPAAETTDADYEAPRNELERTVADIWSRMLGIRRVGIHSDFFKIGGHSLLATQLIADVRRATNTDISVQALFQSPTIAGLTDQVKAWKAKYPDYQLKAIPVIARDGDLPLTFHQEEVWNFERRFPGTARFNGCISMRLQGPLDLKGVCYAVDEIMRRHEVLRTNYDVRNGKSVAIVRPQESVHIRQHDLTGLPSAERDARMLDIANQLARQPFNLRVDLMIRPVLIKLDDDDHMMVIASHYVAVDGWTIGLVVQEFGMHYAKYKDPALPAIPDLPFQNVDYAAWQRQQITDEVINAHLPYWEKQLDDVPPPHPLPTDRRRGFFPSVKGSTFHFTLGPELTARVKTFSHERGYTNFMVFVAALDVLFHLYSGTEDIVLGTMTGDREIGTEGMVGALVNMLALRNRVNMRQSFLEVLENVRTNATDAYAHNIPFGVIAKRMKRNMLRNPFFRAVFILRNVPHTEAKVGDLDVKLATLNLDRGVSDMDVSLYLQDKEGAFIGYFEYNTDLFLRPTIVGLTQNFLTLVNDVLSEPDVPIEELIPARPKAADRGLKRLLSYLGRKEKETIE